MTQSEDDEDLDDSDGGNDDVVMLPSHDREQEKDSFHEPPKRKASVDGPNTSIFAAAEDYEAAINEDLENDSNDELDEPGLNEVPQSKMKESSVKKQHRKRRPSGQGGRPRKKRR